MRHSHIVLCLVCLSTAIIGCSDNPDSYLRSYFMDNGGYSYMSPPRDIMEAGTLVVEQNNGMVYVGSASKCFGDLEFKNGTEVFPEFENRKEWKSNLDAAFNYVPNSGASAKLKALMRDHGIKELKFSLGEARNKVIALLDLEQKFLGKRSLSSCESFLKDNKDARIICETVEVSEMNVDLSDSDSSDFDLAAAYKRSASDSASLSISVEKTSTKKYKVEFNQKPLIVAYKTWNPNEGILKPTSIDKSGSVVVLEGEREYATDKRILAQKILIKNGTKIRVHNGSKLELLADSIVVEGTATIDGDGERGTDGANGGAYQGDQEWISKDAADYWKARSDIDKNLNHPDRGKNGTNGSNGGVGGTIVLSHKPVGGKLVVSVAGGLGGNGGQGGPGKLLKNRDNMTCNGCTYSYSGKSGESGNSGKSGQVIYLDE